jgi:hypothetical protein
MLDTRGRLSNSERVSSEGKRAEIADRVERAIATALQPRPMEEQIAETIAGLERRGFTNVQYVDGEILAVSPARMDLIYFEVRF